MSHLRACIEYAQALVGQPVSPPKPNSLLIGAVWMNRRTNSALARGLIDYAQQRSAQAFVGFS